MRLGQLCEYVKVIVTRRGRVQHENVAHAALKQGPKRLHPVRGPTCAFHGRLSGLGPCMGKQGRSCLANSHVISFGCLQNVNASPISFGLDATSDSSMRAPPCGLRPEVGGCSRNGQGTSVSGSSVLTFAPLTQEVLTQKQELLISQLSLFLPELTLPLPQVQRQRSTPAAP